MKKRLTGMLPTVIRPKDDIEDSAVAVSCFAYDDDFLVFAICNDKRYDINAMRDNAQELLRNGANIYFLIFSLRLRGWSFNRAELICNEVILDFLGDVPTKDGMRCMLRKVHGERMLCLYVFGVFVVLKPVLDPQQNVTFSRVSGLFISKLSFL